MDNRTACNLVLAQIGAESVTDIEWGGITLPTSPSTAEIYTACLTILGTRTLIDNTREKLIALAFSKGVTLEAPTETFTNILLGVCLDE